MHCVHVAHDVLHLMFCKTEHTHPLHEKGTWPTSCRETPLLSLEKLWHTALAAAGISQLNKIGQQAILKQNKTSHELAPLAASLGQQAILKQNKTSHSHYSSVASPLGSCHSSEKSPRTLHSDSGNPCLVRYLVHMSLRLYTKDSLVP